MVTSVNVGLDDTNLGPPGETRDTVQIDTVHNKRMSRSIPTTQTKKKKHKQKSFNLLPNNNNQHQH